MVKNNITTKQSYSSKKDVKKFANEAMQYIKKHIKVTKTLPITKPTIWDCFSKNPTKQ